MYEANNDAAWAALMSIRSGAHQKQLEESQEYWYDEDYLSDYSSYSCHSDCRCPHCPLLLIYERVFIRGVIIVFVTKIS